MHRGVGGITPEQSRLDQVTGRRRLGALRQVQHQCRLLWGETYLGVAELDHAPSGVELQASKSIAARAPGAPLDQACGEVRVDVGHRDIALDEVRARAKLVCLA